MKKVIVLILTISMLFETGVFAESNALNLDDAINQAITNSQQLKVDDLTIQNAEKVYDQAQSDSDKIYMTTIENAKWFVADGLKDKDYVSTQRKAKDLSPEQTKSDWNVAIKSKDLDEASLKLDIYNTYYSLIKAKDDAKIKSDFANISARELKSVDAKYKRGIASKNDYIMAQVAKNNADIQLKLAQRAQKRLNAKFYKQMSAGYQPDVKDLVRNLEYKDVSDVPVEDCIKKALDNRLEVYTSGETERLKQLEFDIINKYYGEGDTEYKDAANNLEDAKLTVDTTKTNIEFEIRTAYINLQNMLDTIEINKEEVQKSEINYSVLKTKRRVGMATTLEVDESKLSLDKTNKTLNDSIMDYIVARAQFDAAQGIGPAIPAETSAQ